MSAESTFRRALRRGFTMVELLVVLTILVVVAGLVVVSVSNVAASSREDVTKIALTNIRDAIFGAGGRGYFADVRAMPNRIADLFRPPPGVPLFNPDTRVGWRGPYLTSQHGFYEVDDDGVAPHTLFTLDYGVAGEPVPFDGWGRPIVLQVPDADGDGDPSPDDLRHVRLVSAGENGVIDTPRTDADCAAPGDAHLHWVPQCVDDLVFYLRVADTRPWPVE